MEPRRPKHKQAPPLEVSQKELERALKEQRAYVFPDAELERAAFPSGRDDG
ncbi:hypothetical protein PR003_g11927 [Phytophthora rubi]|uniref:Uncharacterized protein n=1 Tax=Phytophthora rubi TaxID=129364 RepID=A0A6A4F6R4_9STRA|nr:hypothetical protein PR001_g22319 [Phytophthora rubi]KAE9024222.1 hypothetical protein PR002_g11520 [Phytophthora rubi]KAE9337617.1 hypothetical protein PR003_g11927 [Phytophthora rubi]